MAQSTIDLQDTALARAVVYRYLSNALRYPAQAELEIEDWASALALALEESGASTEVETAAADCRRLACDLDQRLADYGRVIGHTPRAGVPPYESEWLGAAGDLLQYHQMADVAAFYKAFGLDLNQLCDERGDHIAVELAFLQFLCAKEAWAIAHGDEELAHVARSGQAGFLGEHLATWTPAFCRKLETCARGGYYAALARFAAGWIARECVRLSVPCGDPTLAPGESSMTLEETCISCAHASSCVPGGAPPDAGSERS